MNNTLKQLMKRVLEEAASIQGVRRDNVTIIVPLVGGVQNSEDQTKITGCQVVSRARIDLACQKTVQSATRRLPTEDNLAVGWMFTCV